LEAGIDIVRMLLQAGARVNGDFSFENATPLRRAAHIGNAELMKLLLSCGADTECRHRNFEKPITIADRKSHTDVLPC
jgi:ankyrin repeat protein